MKSTSELREQGPGMGSDFDVIICILDVDLGRKSGSYSQLCVVDYKHCIAFNCNINFDLKIHQTKSPYASHCTYY